MGLPAISHDVAYDRSLKMVGVFSPLLREEEQFDALQEVYAIVKAGLATFAERMDRERRRLHGPPRSEAAPEQAGSVSLATSDDPRSPAVREE